MNDKITKKELINSINVFYLKKGILCQNLSKISKQKLYDIYIENNIKYINEEELKKEILNVEEYNYLRDIIHCNFIKYENIPYEIISNINTSTSICELNEIIIKYDLKYEKTFINIKNLVYELYKSYKNYCDNSLIDNECVYITIPSLMKALNKLIINS